MPGVRGAGARVRRVPRSAGEANSSPWWGILVTLACACAAINLFGSISYRLAGLDIRISVRVGVPGASVLAIPPIGRVEARTHPTPIRLEATLEDIDLSMLQEAISRGQAPSRISSQFRNDSGRLVAVIALRMALLAVVGGAFGSAAAAGWRPRRILAGAATALLVGCVLITLTYVTFDERKLANPRYEGVIEAAPWMLGLLDGGLLKAGEVADSMETIASNIRTFFDGAEAFRKLESDRPFVRVLHVSDIHDNPQAFDFLEQIVKSFAPDFIVDTGDITDFGTAAEAKMAAERVRKLGVPYVFIPGNHDSPEVSRMMSSVGGAIVLTARSVSLQGLRVAGLEDPGALRNDMAPASQEELGLAAARLAAIAVPGGDSADGNGNSGAPDILAVHDVRVAEGVLGKVPVVLSGHDHRVSLAVRDGTVMVDAGTTGGAGARGLQVNGGVSMSVALLHFVVDGKSRAGRAGDTTRRAELLAVDTIRILGEKRGFDLERRVVSPSLGARPETPQAKEIR